MTRVGAYRPGGQPPADEDDTTTGSPERGGISRRGLLIGTAGLGLGAAGTAAGVGLVADRGPAIIGRSPSEALMTDHGILKRILFAYREAGRRIRAGEPVPTRAVRQGTRIIHDYIEGFHEGLEEAYVFPRLQQAGRAVDTVRVLLVQHARGRRITADILAATAPGTELPATGRDRLAAAMNSFVRMYEVHEAREDTVVFPALRAIASDKAYAELGERFAAEEDRQLSVGHLAEMIERIEGIEKGLGIYDLGQFTPTAGEDGAD
ncbi:MAG: hemerythrin domain-containing protein [Pseudonocardia sp.]|nr:hemerythrin domain-containing protein [Pseudonocardia sp.]